MAESSKAVSIKLLIDTGSKKVLFAEASKDFVDLLFYILSLPVSTLIRLTGKQAMVGSLPNLYQSLEKLNETYVQPNVTKDTLLKPPLPNHVYSASLLSLDEPPTAAKNFYKCNCYNVVTDDPRTICNFCHNTMNTTVTYVGFDEQESGGGGGGGSGGFVKGVVTYMVMDDLTVSPMSTISSITLLNQFKIKDLGALEEKLVDFGINQAVKLLKAALESDKVLTKLKLVRTRIWIL